MFQDHMRSERIPSGAQELLTGVEFMGIAGPKSTIPCIAMGVDRSFILTSFVVTA
jgi:hypothetical protein